MAMAAKAFTCNNETQKVTGITYPYPRCCDEIGRGHGGVETGVNCKQIPVKAALENVED